MPSSESATDRSAAPALDEGELAELEWLRAENQLLRTERDILLRVASGLVEDANANLLRLWMNRGTP